MRSIPAVSARQFGTFTVAQARDDGWTDSALRHAVRSGRLERVRRGVLAASLEPSGSTWRDADLRLTRSAAALGLVNPRVPVSHSSSAALMQLPLVDSPRHVCVTTPRGLRDEVPGAHLHHGRIPRGELYRANAILVTSPARTIVDIARESGADAAIAAADAALRRRLVDTTRLRSTLEFIAGWPGVRAAGTAVALSDPRSESALESVSRLRIHDAGLPAPELQTRILDLAGYGIARVDFYWDKVGVVGEADGLQKYDGDPTLSLHQEKLRQERLEQCGLIVVRWRWADLSRFDIVAARLRDAFARGARPDRVQRRWAMVPTAA